MDALTALCDTPLAITEEGLRLVTAIASRDEFFSDSRVAALAARGGEPLDNTRLVETRGNVAVLPIRGPLFRHANMFTRVSGATAYGTIARDLQAAVDDPKVASILLEIDSPGGDVNGLFELGDMIRSADAKKPVIAYVGGTAASAALLLASSARRIVASESAMLGSIGVIASYLDTKKAEENAGVRTINIISSVSPDKRLDPSVDSDRAKLQRRIDAMAALFVGAVARNRNVSIDTVTEKFGRGDVLLGQQAVAVGLADSLGSFEALVADMQRGALGAQKETTTMKTVLIALSLSAEATEAEALAAVQELQKTARDQASDLTIANQKLATAEEQITALEHEKLAAEVDAAVNDKRLYPSERDDQLAFAKADPQRFRSLLAKRVPHAPSGKEIKTSPQVKTGASLIDAAEKAIDDEIKADPSIGMSVAMARATQKNPALFEGFNQNEGA